MQTLKKWDIITIHGEPCQLTETPERVDADTWTLVYRTRSGHPSIKAYANDALMVELSETLKA